MLILRRYASQMASKQSPKNSLQRLVSFSMPKENNERFDMMHNKIHLERQIKQYKNKQIISDQIPSTIIFQHSDLNMVLQFIRGIIIGYSIILIPILLAFPFKSQKQLLEYQITDIIIDIIYCILIILRFNTSFFNRKGILIVNRKQIALNYLYGWFLFDIISIVPYKPLQRFNFSIIRILRIYYQSDLAKFILDKYVFSKCNSVIQDSKYFLKKTLNLILTFHLLICIWITIGSFHLSEKSGWIVNFRFQDSTPFQIYLMSGYFILETVSTIGFGDVTPSNITESIFVIVLMKIGVMGYSLILGSIINKLRDSGKQKLVKQEKNFHYQKLSQMLKLKKQDRRTIKKKINEIIQKSNQNEKQLKQKQFLKSLPISLRSKFSYLIYKQTIQNCQCFNNIENTDLLGELFLSLKLIKAEKNTVILPKGQNSDYMYFIQQGQVTLYNHHKPIAFKEKQFMIGEIDMILSQKRHFKYIVEKDSLLLRLNRKDYDKIYHYLFPQQGSRFLKDTIRKFKIIKQLQQDIQHPCQISQNMLANINLIDLLTQIKGMQQKIRNFNLS